MKFLVASLLVLCLAIGSAHGRKNAPPPKWANDVRHGACVTNDGSKFFFALLEILG